MCDASQRLGESARDAVLGCNLDGVDLVRGDWHSGGFRFADGPNAGLFACLRDGDQIELRVTDLALRQQWGLPADRSLVLARFISPSCLRRSDEEYLLLLLSGYRLYPVPLVGQAVSFSGLRGRVVAVSGTVPEPLSEAVFESAEEFAVV